MRVHVEQPAGVGAQVALVHGVGEARVLRRVSVARRQCEEGRPRRAVGAHGGAVFGQRELGRVVVGVGHAHAHRCVAQQPAAVAGRHAHLPLGARLAVQRHARRERAAGRVDGERLAQLRRRDRVRDRAVLPDVVVVRLHLRTRAAPVSSFRAEPSRETIPSRGAFVVNIETPTCH